MKRLVRSIIFTAIIVLWAVEVLASNICLKTCAPQNGFGISCTGAPVSFPDNICADSVYCYLLNNLQITNCSDKESLVLNLAVRTNAGATDVTNYTMSQNEGVTTVFTKLSNTPSGGTMPTFAMDQVVGESRIWVDSTENGKLCLYTDTIYGPQQILCKPILVPASNPVISARCSAAANSCFNMDANYSMSLFNFSGNTYQCLTETLDRVFYINTYHCPTTNGVDLDMLNIFANFQNALRQSVMAALVLYVMLFGIKILLGEIEMKTSSGLMFIVKIIFVGYFAVGLAPIPFLNNNYARPSGVVDFALPILKQAMTDFASMVFNAGSSDGVCVFNPSDYPPGRGYYAVWDAIDCRISHYMGMKLAWGFSPPDPKTGASLISTKNLTSSNQSITAITFPSPKYGTVNAGSVFSHIPFVQEGDDSTTGGLFSFVMLIYGFFTSGNFIVGICALVFLLIFLSTLLSVVSSFLVSLVTLYAMAYISPIFVPMVLFDRTKSYFDAWLKFMLGITLQPMIIMGFLALIMNIYDQFMYSGCSFLTDTYSIPSSTGLVSHKFNVYRLGYTDGNEVQCKLSLAYTLANYYLGNGWNTLSLFITYISYIVVENLPNMMINMFMMFLISVIVYYFSDTVKSLASELSGGPSLNAVTVSAQTLLDGVVSTAIYVAKAVATKGKSVAEDMKRRLEDRTGIKMGRSAGPGGGGKAGALSDVMKEK